MTMVMTSHARIVQVAVALAAVAAAYETCIMIRRKLQRRKLFRLAKQRSIDTGLPLLVVGDPHNGLASIATGSDYGCGDVCVDLTGCSRCQNTFKGRLEDAVTEFKLDKYVIYISCVLEYVDDIDFIAAHLRSVPPENLFVVTVEWYSLMAWFYPHFLTNEQPCKNIVYRAPPYSKTIWYRKIRA